MQYKFRGKRVIDNMWIYGSLISWPDGDKEIITTRSEEEADKYAVFPETVGMCSTITDQNTRDIYEGDVIKVAGRLLKVVFDAGCFLSLWCNNRYRLNEWGAEGVEIKGNIHDNPELVNPSADSPTLNTMQNFDPNAATQAEGQPATNDQVQATEQEAQENAMESEETEG
jgi:hypothetical protein